MKFLNQFQIEALPSERIEKKFLMSQGQTFHAIPILLNFGFSKANPDRLVNSIYFDDIDQTSLADNVEGSPIRDKLRARYYGTLPGKITIEIKHKRYYLGYKSSFPVDENVESLPELVSSVEQWCKENVRDALFPSAHVSYERSYYTYRDFRMTVDRGIRAGRLSTSHKLASPFMDYEVIEFKYPQGLDSEFRDLYGLIDKFSLRNTKSSKYSNALMW
mgnify:CR=1 FL=1